MPESIVNLLGQGQNTLDARSQEEQVQQRTKKLKNKKQKCVNKCA